MWFVSALRGTRVAALLAAGLTGGCATATQAYVDPPPAACDGPETVFAGLHVQTLSRSETLQGIQVPEGRGIMRPTISHRVVGPCTDRIARFVMERCMYRLPPSDESRLTAGSCRSIFRSACMRCNPRIPTPRWRVVVS